MLNAHQLHTANELGTDGFPLISTTALEQARKRILTNPTVSVASDKK